MWAREGWHLIEEGRWLAFSGLPSVDYNLACCYGSEANGAECAKLLEQTLDDVRTAAVPCVVSVAGVALGSVQVLVDAGWVCVAQQPFMRLPALDAPVSRRDSVVRCLGTGDAYEVLAVVADAFGVQTPMEALPVPGDGKPTGTLRWWGVDIAGELLSVAASSVAGPSAVLWWVATRRSQWRQGHARRLLTSVHSQLVAEGIDEFLLCSSMVGMPLYYELGYRVLEYFQQWSRPRWALGRG